VLDVGAGMGMWRDWYRLTHPGVQVLSVDISPYACEQWGHELRDIATWAPPAPFDLVVCHGVVHYLDDAAAEAAIGNLGAATGAVLYLELPTAHDLAVVVDPERTDMAVHHRSGQWYRERLAPWFQQAGAGLWVRHGTVPLFELEAAAP
jgi:SAM-dependent methyltransferase